MVSSQSQPNTMQKPVYLNATFWFYINHEVRLMCFRYRSIWRIERQELHMKESWHSPIELKFNVFSKPRTVMVPKCRCIAWRKWRVACKNYGECTTFSATEFQVVLQDTYTQEIEMLPKASRTGFESNIFCSILAPISLQLKEKILNLQPTNVIK